MSVAAVGPELTAELRERAREAADFQEACVSILAAVLERVGFDRACLLVRAEGGVAGAGWRVPASVLDALVEAAREPGSEVAAALDAVGPFPLSHAGRRPGADFVPRLALPIPQPGDGDVLLLMEARQAGEETAFVAAALERCATALARLAALDRLRERSSQLATDRGMGRELLDGLPDPVLLVDGDMRVHMANARADGLFFSTGSDSEGRSRAVQFNAFHLNVMLTEMNLAEDTGRVRELTLADPRDGSDIHYEVLAAVLSETDEERRYLALVLRDITDLKQVVTELEMENRNAREQERRARKESRRLAAILEDVAEPVLVTDSDSDIALMNREAERLFGAPAGSGQQADRSTRSNVAKLTSFVNELLLRQDRRREGRLSLERPDQGTELPMEVVSTKVLDDHREALAVVSVLRDLSPLLEKQRMAQELRQLNEELEERVDAATRELEERNRLLEWQSEELEKASRLKSQFLASMSHELRTPINAMLGYTSLMRDQIYGPLNEEQERALDKVNAASEHLLELINDILDLSKIEAGKMPVEVEEVRLDELVQEISKTVQPMIRETSLELLQEVDGDLPTLRTDRTKVRQILLNLVENAIRYTSSGWVAVRARSVDRGPEDETETAGSGRVRIEVEDTGEGIDEEHLETIFDDFRQLDSSRTRRHGGAGLGLSISQKLAALMEGSIAVESEIGEGTRFIIELPMELDPGGVDEQAHRALMTTARRTTPDATVSSEQGGSPQPSGP